MHLLDRRFGLVAVVMVRAGDPIARGGAHSFELLVADFDFFYCPTDFLGAEVRDEIRQQLHGGFRELPRRHHPVRRGRARAFDRLPDRQDRAVLTRPGSTPDVG